VGARPQPIINFELLGSTRVMASSMIVIIVVVTIIIALLMVFLEQLFFPLNNKNIERGPNSATAVLGLPVL